MDCKLKTLWTGAESGLLITFDQSNKTSTTLKPSPKKLEP